MLIVDLNSKTNQTNSWKKNLFRAINYKAQEILDEGKKKYAAIHSLFIQFLLYSFYYHLYKQEKLDQL